MAVNSLTAVTLSHCQYRRFLLVTVIRYYGKFHCKTDLFQANLDQYDDCLQLITSNFGCYDNYGSQSNVKIFDRILAVTQKWQRFH